MGRLVDLEVVKEYAGVKRDERDSFIERLISGAESAVERFCQRRFGPEPLLVETPGDENADPPTGPTFKDTAPVVTKTFASRGFVQIGLPDLREPTSMSFAGMTLITDLTVGLTRAGDSTYFAQGAYHEQPYTMLELSHLIDIHPNWIYVEGQQDLTIKGRWGFNPTPDDVVDAVCQLVARRYKKKDANWADAVQLGPSDGAGSSFNYFKALPAEIQEILRSYQRHRVAII